MIALALGAVTILLIVLALASGVWHIYKHLKGDEEWED